MKVMSALTPYRFCAEAPSSSELCTETLEVRISVTCQALSGIARSTKGVNIRSSNTEPQSPDGSRYHIMENEPGSTDNKLIRQVLDGKAFGDLEAELKSGLACHQYADVFEKLALMKTSLSW